MSARFMRERRKTQLYWYHSLEKNNWQGRATGLGTYLELLKVSAIQALAGSNEIAGVFYKANEYASLNPNFLGCVENALGIREWLESNGHQYIVTDDKEGPNCEVVVSPPFVFLSTVKALLRSDFAVAAQNCWVRKGGAFTGEIRGCCEPSVVFLSTVKALLRSDFAPRQCLLSRGGALGSSSSRRRHLFGWD